MAPIFGWMSGSFSSFEITIASVLFIVVCITLCTLCTNCFSQSSKTPQYSKEKETPSSNLPKERPEDQWSTNRTSGNQHALNSMPKRSVPQVPARPHTRSATMVQSQPPTVYTHNRAESHGYFSQGMMPWLTDTPGVSVGSKASIFPRIPDPPLLPSTFHQPRVQVEPAMQPPSLQQPETVIKDHDTRDREDQSYTSDMFTDHTYSVPGPEVSEEHPYESIGMVNVSEPSPLSSSNEAAENQFGNESPYQTMAEPGEPAAGHSSTSLTVLDNGQAEKPGKLFLPLPAEQDGQCLTGSESTAVYAAVNWKKKTMKLVEFPTLPTTMALDEDDVTEEAAPPIPEKHFE
ncbi:uncharacterized protein LOC118815355 [Colossoma macropomum]|uniref:uncharacterized protein LOC118815355 n=1 Tax=Colossoma macropomum TaxID=42526 RepID=UPI00186464DA|nr:uncharacterized protein LOC118815355 [Colossoma macropomum]